MIELRELVAAPGLAPVTASVRVGEVVRLDGPPAAARAVLEVLAGRRAALAGEVRWRDPRGRAVLVRAGERLPSGLEPAAARALWCELAGGAGGPRAHVGGVGEAAAAAARGFGVAPAVWLIDGPREPGVEAVVAAADDEVRGGAGALVWTATAMHGHADRVITVELASVGAGGAPRATAPAASAAEAGGSRVDGARRLWALARFAGAAAAARAAVACAAVSAVWLALIAAVVATHEGFWFIEGSGVGLAWIARFGALGAAAVTAVAAATRAARAQAWPAMLRETRAGRPSCALALVLGDAGGAAPAAVVAAWPALWTSVATAGQGGALRPLVATVAVVFGAVVAGAVTRGARRLAAVGAAVGALVGLGLAAWVMW